MSKTLQISYRKSSAWEKILVTMDVRSLSTNIPRKERNEAMETNLKRKKYRIKNYLDISPLGFNIK